MQEIRAQLKHLRIAPKKVRMVTALLKGIDFRAAQAQLKHLHQKSVGPLAKLLASAGANAEHNSHLAKDDLYVKSVKVDAGSSLKRQSRTWRGMAYPMFKRTSHVTIVLGVREGAHAAAAGRDATHGEGPKKERRGEKTHRAVQPGRETRKGTPRAIASTKTRMFRRKAI